MLISHFHPRLQSLSALIGNFVQVLVHISEVENVFGKVNWEHIVCPLYRGSLYLRESVMGGSTI